MATQLLLPPVVGIDQVRVVEKALVDKTEVPTHALQAIMQAYVGANLHRAERAKLQYALFVQSITERIEQLEFQNYAEGR